MSYTVINSIKNHLYYPDAGKQQELRTYLNSVKKQDLDTQESNTKKVWKGLRVLPEAKLLLWLQSPTREHRRQPGYTCYKHHLNQPKKWITTSTKYCIAEYNISTSFKHQKRNQISYFLTDFKQIFYSEHEITGRGIFGQKQKEQILPSHYLCGRILQKNNLCTKDNPNKSYLTAEIIF